MEKVRNEKSSSKNFYSQKGVYIERPNNLTGEPVNAFYAIQIYAKEIKFKLTNFMTAGFSPNTMTIRHD